MALSSSTRLGPYEILSPLGAGGMGEVYRARDTKLNREVAIKVLPEQLATDRDALARFEREARAVAALNHPNILSIHDFGSEKGTPYAVMELLEGQTLREKLLAGALPQRKVIDYATQIALGLAAAHEKGIIHRDLKPDNIFVTKDGRVKILDFGLAKHYVPAAQDSSHSPTVSAYTEPGAILGTVGYMSPEQVRGKPLDVRSDIFSFGSVLYEMLTGQRAFRGESMADTMSAIIQKDPPFPSSPDQAISPSIDHLLRRCLEKNPVERFQTARDLTFALGEAGQSVGTKGSSAALSSRREGRWAIAAIVIMLALGAVAWFLLGRKRQTESPGSSTSAVSTTTSASNSATGATAPAANSIVVLPFKNLSGDPKQQYFSDGITEELTNALGQNAGLTVIAWETASKFANTGETPAEIGKALNVAHVLDGSIEREGEQVRVTTELVRAATGQQLWSAHYDDTRHNIFAVQDKISAAIAAALQVKFAGMPLAPTQNPEAHELYLKGLAALERFTAGDAQIAQQNFQQAVKLDPNYADAWAELAYSYLQMSEVSTLPIATAMPKARVAARKALALDPRNVQAQLESGRVDANEGRIAQARAEFELAIALDPSNARAHLYYGFVLPPEESLAQDLEAARLNPDSALTQFSVGLDALDLHDWPMAARAAQAAIKLSPQDLNGVFELAYAYAQLRRGQDAVRAFDLLQPGTALDKQLVEAGQLTYRALLNPALRPEALAALDKLRHAEISPVARYHLTSLYAVLGEKEPAIQMLPGLCTSFPNACNDMAVNPVWTVLHGDPRFEKLSKQYTTLVQQ